MKSCILLLGFILSTIYSIGQFEMISQTMNIYVKHEGTEWGNGASFYDFNHDGWDDLTTANGDSAIQFFLNNGEGILEELEIVLPMIVTHDVIAIIWVDFDNDGDSDLFTTQYGGRIYLLQNDGNLNFTDVTEIVGLPIESYNYYGASFADVNKDGVLDIYVSKYYNPIVNPQSEFSSLFFFGDSNGTFIDATISSGLQQPPSPSFQSVFFDYDLDGFLDLFIIVDRSFWPNELFRNNGDGTFTEVSGFMDAEIGSDSMCANVGDFDNDLDYDIFVTDGPTGNVFLKNNYPLPFTDIAESEGLEVNLSCWGTQWIDADNDGWQDLFVCTTQGIFSSAQNKFFKNNGNLGFEDATIEFGLQGDVSPSMCTILGDLNNDGYYDYYNNNNDPFHSDLWRNLGGTNNFIALTLEGTISNKDAVGTNVTAHFGGNQAMRLKQFGESYIAQNSGKEIFGLEESELVDSLIIQWPNGLIEKYYNLVSNQFYHFIEGNATSQIFQLISSETTLCPGQTIVLDAGEASSYLWNDGTTDRYNYVSEPGDYQVEITDQNGIVYLTNLISIAEQAPPFIEVTSASPTCNGYSNGSISFDYSYEENTLLYFNDQVIFENMSNLTAGEYSYSLISQSGCYTNGIVVLNEPDMVYAEFNTYNPQCADNFGKIEVFNIAGGTAPYSIDYFEQNPEALIEGENVFLILDNQGCPFVGEYEIVAPETISLELSSSPQVGEISGEIYISANGGTGALEFFLNGESIGNNNTVEALSGNYTITVIDENGCEVTSDILVGFEVLVNEIESQLSCYPNPISNQFTMEVGSPDISEQLFVFSAQGKLVFSEKINSFKTKVDTSNWSEGIYFLKIGNKQKLLIKQ